ncbi:MAG TPA: substrate-binding domain-containing protein [Anaeromyxobacter sp.]|nr:substrate-binding domain-containing protein [Anaeromyxobacter sp.]
MTSDGVQRASIRYDGATTIGLNLLPDLVPLYRQLGYGLSYVGERGTNPGLEAVRAGEVDVAGVMREITAAERAEPLRWALIGHDALGVFVHPSNPVLSLDRAQLKGIFTGAVRSWDAVGGPARPILPLSEKRAGGRGTVVEFRRLVLEGADYGPVRELEDAPDCVKEVAAEPGGITVASTSMAIPGVRTLAVEGVAPTPEQVRARAYALGRPMYLVARAAASTAAAALLDLALSDAGQAIVARKFTPAR